MTDASYAEQAAQFIAEAERIAALGLPQLPEDPAAAAAMRAAGYEVLAEVAELHWPVAVVQLAGDDEDAGARHAIPAADLARVLEVSGDDLAGREFIATLRESPETGPVLSGFRPAVAAEDWSVVCLLLFGDQAELVPIGAEEASPARWPAAAIAAETGVPVEDLPGMRFRVSVAGDAGRLAFSRFRLLP